ncbi:MAG: crossover junction endodeoxyribonuclease RuvC [Nitrospirae bacterium]|nr:crossover junction endodeoxyribonuclease RuvC [Nitrospirota bacterium]
MRVLGIDPGTVTTGYGVVDEDGGRITFVGAGGVATSAKQAFPERLKKIYEGLQAVIAEHHPDMVAVESLYFAKNVQSALKLGHARGVAVLAAVMNDLPVYEYSPTEIKQAVVGYGAAEKPQVQKMVMTLLKMDAIPAKLDTTDALAAAICHIHSARMKDAVKGRKK